MEEILVGLIVVAYCLGAPGLGIAAFVRLRTLRATVERLEADVRALKAGAPAAAAQPAPTFVPEAVTEPAPPPLAPAPEASPPRPEAAAPAPTEPAGPAAESLEQRLTSRWLVWLGAATMALAGVFLVKYAVDFGLLGPAARVGLGVLLGLVLIAAGEWLRRRPLTQRLAAVRPDYVPAALTAAGLFTLFGSAYAAFALYSFLAPGIAFVALSLIALAAVALALLHGPLVAVLGLVGGFATPMLIAAGEPVAWAVFGFLAVLTACLAAIIHWVRWWPLAWLTLTGAVFWPLLWLAAVFVPGDATVLGLYLLVIGAAAIAATGSPPAMAEVTERVPWLARPMVICQAWIGAVALCLFVLARVDGYGVAAMLAIAAFTVSVGAVALLMPERETLLAPAVVLILALLALWHLPELLAAPFAPTADHPREPVLPPSIPIFAATAAGYAALFGLGGFLALPRAARPLIWAGVSAALPPLILTIVYWRLAGFAVDLHWTPAALALAALAVAAVAQCRRAAAHPAQDEIVALYAAAAIAALSLAATMALRQAWLSVALSLQLPALAWITLRLGGIRLRQLAAIVAGVVLVRLAFNPYLLDYGAGEIPGLNWVLYGYGLPALAFFWAARMFRQHEDDWLVALLDGGGIAFAVLLVTLEIQLAVSHQLASWPDDLLALGLQSSAWFAVALALTSERAWFARPVVVWCRRVLVGLAIVQSLLLQLLAFNPLWWGRAVGTVPLFNVLLPAYGLPALLAAACGWRERQLAWLARAASICALVLAFAFVSLSVRQAFHGSDLSGGEVSNAEWYSYSLAWLTFAGLVLALGIWRRSVQLRWASLVIVMTTVAKVFLFDMDDLEGLWRVASFLGLGLSLVAIGFIYQRLVFPIGAAMATAAASSEGADGA